MLFSLVSPTLDRLVEKSYLFRQKQHFLSFFQKRTAFFSFSAATVNVWLINHFHLNFAVKVTAQRWSSIVAVEEGAGAGAVVVVIWHCNCSRIFPFPHNTYLHVFCLADCSGEKMLHTKQSISVSPMAIYAYRWKLSPTRKDLFPPK